MSPEEVAVCEQPRGARHPVRTSRTSAGVHRRGGPGALGRHRRGALQEPLPPEQEGEPSLPGGRGPYDGHRHRRDRRPHRRGPSQFRVGRAACGAPGTDAGGRVAVRADQRPGGKRARPARRHAAERRPSRVPSKRQHGDRRPVVRGLRAISRGARESESRSSSAGPAISRARRAPRGRCAARIPRTTRGTGAGACRARSRRPVRARGC